MQVYCSNCNEDYNMQPQVAQLPNRIEKCYFICSHCGHEVVAAYVNDKIRKHQVDSVKYHERINKKNLANEDEMQ
ncbi:MULTISPECIES: hypothetical protein [Bacillus cereus group]|uniref:hypothetical protein n=1 Tax=Bacillus cereus group TaxID=86661 RepID=UPI000BFA6775|nr:MULTISPECIES: hypothetical protein [Bacillus cereus group]PEV16371.1 hypothetical protein CN407_01980 [Bacillus cereus]PGM68982.1 hypothetical protein CN950_06205 [Bacillus cereus]PGW41236.1 hypothetical protein COE03_25265 [Bacillus thuringiensis]HDR8447676.1 hypothetical protein [Bacillus cereus]HDR8462843.1 hypothetical protein [Bacillus cereus]